MKSVKINNEWTPNDLSEDKRRHLAWRLDSKTYCGIFTACAIARLEHEDTNEMPVYKIFMAFGMNERSAKIHASKVISFRLKDDPRLTVDLHHLTAQ